VNIKVIIGIILFIAGLGLGVWSWITSGFTTEFPTLGLISTLIGLYFLITAIIESRRKRTILPGISIPADMGSIPEIAIPLVGLALGKIAYDKVREYYSSRQSSLTPEQIAALEAKLDELYREGRIEPTKYYEAKKILESLKRRT